MKIYKIFSVPVASVILIFALIFSNFAYANIKGTINDSAITSAVITKLKSDPSIPSSNISVKTNNRVVVLSGTVATQDQVDNAVQTAESVSGVRNVNSKLTLQNNQQPLTDSLITAKIKGLYLQKKVFSNQSVSVTGVSVETKNGVVYLTGQADNRAQVRNAVRLAKSVQGVKRVVSTVKVAK